MIDENSVSENIRRGSVERSHRIVIDEKLPNGSFRILVSRLKPGLTSGQKRDSSAWEDEEVHYLKPKKASELLSGVPVRSLAEGRVFEISQGEVRSVYKNERERVKEKTAKLLVREGKSMRRDVREMW